MVRSRTGKGLDGGEAKPAMRKERERARALFTLTFVYDNLPCLGRVEFLCTFVALTIAGELLLPSPVPPPSSLSCRKRLIA